MSQNDSQPMNPHLAMSEAERVKYQVRRKARWHGWVWLAVAVLTPAFLLGTQADLVPRAQPDDRPFVVRLLLDGEFWIAIGFGAIAATLWILETRRGVIGRETARIDRPATWAYVTAMVAVAVLVIALDPVGTPWWFVAVSFAPSMPCVFAAWRILRS
ncbi:MAG TPA: hypothetical protein VFZ37_06265 [Jiangellaceae bacterium]